NRLMTNKLRLGLFTVLPTDPFLPQAVRASTHGYGRKRWRQMVLRAWIGARPINSWDGSWRALAWGRPWKAHLRWHDFTLWAQRIGALQRTASRYSKEYTQKVT